MAQAPLEDGGRDELARDALWAGKKEYAKEAQAVQDETETPVNGTSDEPLEAVVAM